MSDLSLLHMPLDILIKIFTLLETSDLRNLMLTCKTMRDFIINENTLWRLISRAKIVVKDKQREMLSWYSRCRISYNWRKGIFKNKIIVQHNGRYMPWLQFCEDERLYLSVGSELRCYTLDKNGTSRAKVMWSLEVPKIKRMDIRTNDISRFIVKNNHIVCGNRDGSATVYKLNDDRKPQLLSFIEDCHENGNLEVSAVEKVVDTIVTISSNSPKVKLWQPTIDVENFAMDSNSMTSYDHSQHEIEITNEIGCRCVATNKGEDKLAIGLNGNSKALLLDVNTGKALIWSTSFRNIKDEVRDIQWHDENCIVYVTYLGRLFMMDTRTSDVVYATTDPFFSSLYCVKSDSYHAVLVGSSEYSRCVLFDIRNTHHVQIYFSKMKSSSPIYSLDFDSKKLLASTDRGVTCFNFNVNSSKIPIRDYSHKFEVVTHT